MGSGEKEELEEVGGMGRTPPLLSVRVRGKAAPLPQSKNTDDARAYSARGTNEPLH